MRNRKGYIVFWFFVLIVQVQLLAQENFFSHYFMAASAFNPALTGDTRFARFQLVERIQPTVSHEMMTNTLVSYDQKLINHRSGFGISINQRSARYREWETRFNYSYTLMLFKRFWAKAGLGVSLHNINTRLHSYTFPDQYDNYGLIPGAQTGEMIDGEKIYYAGVSAGLAAYTESMWLSLSVNELNRPRVSLFDEDYRAPLRIDATWGWLIPFDKNKRPRRIFAPNGGLKPYSSAGPIATFHKNGPFHSLSFGINAFTNPVFWGLSYRYNAVFDSWLREGAASLHFLAGYRTETFCIGYSYDFMLNRTPTNFKGAHEISLVWYLYSVKADYKINKPFPFPNQLMY